MHNFCYSPYIPKMIDSDGMTKLEYESRIEEMTYEYVAKEE
jgi:hypothetical protein